MHGRRCFGRVQCDVADDHLQRGTRTHATFLLDRGWSELNCRSHQWHGIYRSFTIAPCTTTTMASGSALVVYLTDTKLAQTSLEMYMGMLTLYNPGKMVSLD